MNVFNKVTLQSLKKNKTRTVVTVIGIMLSAAMICAVTTFVSSMYNYALENAIYTEGDWHGAALNSEWSVKETIESSEQVENVVFAEQLGYAEAEGCTNENKPYIYILGVYDGFEDIMPVHLTAGKYPTSSSEILLPDHLASNGGVGHKIGDSLTLNIGDRVSDGYKMWQNNPFYTYDEYGNDVPIGEELIIRETRSYTVVGFYERPSFEEYTAPGYTALTLADNTPSKAYLYSAWFKMKNAEEVYSFMKENSISGTWNSQVLTYSGVSRYDSFDSMITSLAAIVIGLIMFGSVSLIYNAFSISVSERTKQFGLLSSVGATKKQLRRMVFFEAFAVSLVGIPLGIAVGIGGIGVTLMLIGHKFESIIGYPIPLRVSVSGLSVIIAAAVALITVLISAWIPSKRATKVSAVEAIRQNMDISAKGKKVKTSRLTYKLFGLSGMLATKHYKRNKRKYRTTVISLFMSIVLFVSASAFTDYLMESVSGGFSTYNYDLHLYVDPEDFADITKEELLAEVKDDKSVTDVAYIQARYVSAKANKTQLTEQAVTQIEGDLGPESTNKDTLELYSRIIFVNDDEFKTLLKEQKLDEKKYMDPNAPLAVAVDGGIYFDTTEGKYITMNYFRNDNTELSVSWLKEFEGYYHQGPVVYDDGTLVNRFRNYEDSEDYFDIPEDESYDEAVLRSGKVIYDAPFYVEKRETAFIYPESLKNSVLPGLNARTAVYQYLFTTDNHTASYNAVKQTLTELGFNSGNLVDYAAEVENERNTVTIIQVFSYGFIVLISLIAAANVFNTISTNISLRRREFAMLKSVGMTAKGFNRMMNYECLLYGSRALLFGLPAAAGVTFLIYLAVSEGYEAGFRLPWLSIGIAVLSVFAVVFATMMYSMSKIKKENPIDALKNENL